MSATALCAMLRWLRSLLVQGGAAADAELEHFTAHPWAADALCLRRWDDLAKIPGAAAPEPGDLLGRLTRLAL